MNKVKTNFWIDMVLFTLLILVLMPGATGIKLHQWIGIGMGAGALIHLVLHWTWIKTVFANRKPGRVRRLFWLDIALGLSFIWTVCTGLMISPLLGSSSLSHMAHTHHAGAMFFVIFSIAHLVMHRKWISQNARRYILAPRALSPQK